MSGLLQGKLAFVTGGGSGIGRSTCEIFSREGATVVVADINLKSAEETVSLLENNADSTALTIDVTNINSIKQAYDAVLQKYNTPPSIVVNSAGIIQLSKVSDLKEEDLDEILNVNLKGPVFVTQIFANGMVKHEIAEGSIVNLSSVTASTTHQQWGAYAMSKAALTSFTKTAALEYGKHGIRCNAVAPGVIKTPMAKALTPQMEAGLNMMTARGKLGRAEEVAEVIAFLTSSKSSHVTGASYEISGGYKL